MFELVRLRGKIYFTKYILCTEKVFLQNLISHESLFYSTRTSTKPSPLNLLTNPFYHHHRLQHRLHRIHQNYHHYCRFGRNRQNLDDQQDHLRKARLTLQTVSSRIRTRLGLILQTSERNFPGGDNQFHFQYLYFTENHEKYDDRR